jgi:hypothetical protein
MSTPDVPSSPPLPRPDYYRNALKTLADRNRVAVECTDEQSQRAWWATYRIVNLHGSSAENYLGSSSGTTEDVAREHGAQRSLETLRALINWSESVIVDDVDGYANTSV